MTGIDYRLFFISVLIPSNVRLQKYYGYAIRKNVGNVQAMVKATKAILFHSCKLYDPEVVEEAKKKMESRKKKKEQKEKKKGNEKNESEEESGGKEDGKEEKEEKDIHTYSHNSCPKTEEERHQFCPPGENSWCKWQKDVATGSTTYKVERTLPHSFFHELWPHFEALSNEALLKRCEKGYSQNEVHQAII